MKYRAIKFGTLLLAGAMVVSCNSDSNKSNGGGSGPSATASFVGTSVTFNPTLTFLSNGQVTYVNEETGSEFELAPASEPLSGTYSYLPSSDFLTGDLTVDIEGIGEVTIALSEFVTSNGLVRSFTMTFPEDGAFQAIVEGSLEAAAAANNGGGATGGGTGGGSASGAENFTFESNGNIAAGTTFTKEYLSGNTQGNVSASPLPNYNTGDSVEFTIANDGSLTFDGISLPFQNATDGGIISWSTATVTAVFDTGATSAPSDLTITYTEIDFTDLANPKVDAKVFAN